MKIEVTKILTPEEFKAAMSQAFDKCDTESAHVYADELMCDLLRKLGYGEGIDIFDSEEKWYA
jgi:hypothetical protein